VVSRREVDDGRTWSRHYQDTWHERSGDPRLPRWFRLVCLAYGSHDNSGHARFKRGEVALVLGAMDQATGEVIPLSRQRVHEAVRQAVELGFLSEGSIPMCLVVPAHDVRKGANDAAPKTCPVHVRRARP
jgi:hypothetical protein